MKFKYSPPSYLSQPEIVQLNIPHGNHSQYMRSFTDDKLVKQGHGRSGIRWVTTILALVLLVAFLSACGGESTPTFTVTPKATTTPIPTPTPQGISPDQNLAEIIAAANEGDTIILGPGVFTLAQGIEINKSLTLLGAGYDQTMIESSAPGEDFSAAVMYSGSGLLSIQGITLSYIGSDPAAVLYGKSGSISLKDCYFSGATLSSSGSQLGAIHLANEVVVDIVNSKIAGSMERIDQDNPDKVPGGIIIYGNARLTIEASEIFDSYLGIYAYGESEVVARNGNIHNTFSGVSLLENATATLENNTFRDNTSIHLILFGDSSAVVTGNSFSGISTGTGVQAHGNGNVHLEGNTFADLLSCIIFTENATGDVIANTLSSFSNIGIFVQGYASPEFDSNIIAGENSDAIGITYEGNAAGTARGNQISNLDTGISLSGMSAPLLESNTIQNCTQGIFYQEESSGTATLNTIQFGHIGILIDSPAYPTITSNTIQAYYQSIMTNPVDWIDKIPVAGNTLQDGEPDIVIVTVTPQP